MKKILFTTVLMGGFLFAHAQAPEKLEYSKTSYVNDFADIYTPAQEMSLDGIMRNFHDTVQMTVVTINSLDGREPVDYATTVANKWGVGSKSNNGLLLLISAKDHKMFAVTGRGIQGDLPDIKVVRLQKELAVPLFKEEKYYEGTYSLLNAYIHELSPSTKEIRKAQEAAEKRQNAKTLAKVGDVFFVLLILGLIAAIVWYVRKQMQKRKAAAKERYTKIYTRAVENSLRLNRMLDTLKKGIALDIPGAVTLRDTLQAIGDQIPKDLKNEENLEKFSNLFEAQEKTIKESVANVKTLIDTYDGVIHYLNTYNPKTFTDDYERLVTENFKPVFKDDESDKTIPKAIRQYGDLIKEHLLIRERIGKLVFNKKFLEAKAMLSLYAANIVAIQKLDQFFKDIKEEDAKKVNIGNNAKKFIRERTAALLSYCDEKTSTAKDCHKARITIEEVSERNAQMGTDPVANYGLYLTLMGMLQKDAEAPYKAAKIREANELAQEQAITKKKNEEEAERIRKRRREEEEEESRRRSSSYSSSYASSSSSYSSDSSSSSSSSFDSGSSFGGGSFDGGGGGSSW